MSKTQESFIRDILRHEREFGHELPDNSFFKSIALSIVKALKLTWGEAKELYL